MPREARQCQNARDRRVIRVDCRLSSGTAFAAGAHLLRTLEYMRPQAALTRFSMVGFARFIFARVIIPEYVYPAKDALRAQIGEPDTWYAHSTNSNQKTPRMRSRPDQPSADLGNLRNFKMLREPYSA